VNRNLKKIPFYRITSTLSGPVLSRTETDNGQPIVRTNTPPPATIVMTYKGTDKS
jgi:hypothetical protein